MNSYTSIKKNYLYSVVYQLLLIISPLITSPYISRKLGPDMIGTQSYYYSIATYFLLFIMLGVNNYGNRSVARVREDKEKLSHTFWTIYGSQFLRSVIITCMYVLYVLLFAKEYFTIAAINGLYVFSGLLDINWFFFGLEQFKVTVTRNVIIKLINIALLFLLIRQPSDLWKYSLIIVLVAVVSNGYLWLYLRKLVDWYRPNFSEMLQHIKPELILFIPVIAVSLYKVMDRIMLGMMSDNVQVGFYSSAESVVNIPMSLITALGTVMLPRISHLIAIGDTEKSKKYIEASMVFTVAMSSAMAFGLSAIAPIFAPVFFGEQFTACGPLIIGLSVTIFFTSWANVIRTQYLIPNGKDKSYLISIVSGAVVNLILNTLFIPHFEAMGALIGTISAEGIVCIMQTVMVKSELPIKQYLKECIVFLLMGVGMFFAVRFVGTLISRPLLKLVVEILTGVVVYCTFIFAFIYNSRDPVYISIRSQIQNIKLR